MRVRRRGVGKVHFPGFDRQNFQADNSLMINKSIKERDQLLFSSL